MKCPVCGASTRVNDSRAHDKYVQRRRECKDCFTRFTTTERLILNSIDKHVLDRILCK
ncbi:hypothetical protein [Cytobacillus depressus]|uniref:NrdR family transcriptional regulator n=1 Tax=Cytobacillus depressus TaxID=1602942 RepID=UPI003CCE3CE6